jgi:hypothetical protein
MNTAAEDLQTEMNIDEQATPEQPAIWQYAGRV